MVVICGECGEKIVVDADVADGQHVLCPYCNDKFSYHKPEPASADKRHDALGRPRTSWRKSGGKPRVAQGSRINICDVICAVSMVAILLSVLAFLVLQHAKYEKAKTAEAERQRKEYAAQQAKEEHERKIAEENWDRKYRNRREAQRRER